MPTEHWKQLSPVERAVTLGRERMLVQVRDYRLRVGYFGIANPRCEGDPDPFVETEGKKYDVRPSTVARYLSFYTTLGEPILAAIANTKLDTMAGMRRLVAAGNTQSRQLMIAKYAKPLRNPRKLTIQLVPMENTNVR